MLTDDQLRFVVLVLDGSVIDLAWEDPGVEDAREGVRRRVRELRGADPRLGYAGACLAARVAWLRDYLAALTRKEG